MGYFTIPLATLCRPSPLWFIHIYSYSFISIIVTICGQSMCTREEERNQLSQGFQFIIGEDEAGAGCLAGPVTICACYIPIHVDIPGINDSKKLSPGRRETLFKLITEHPDVKYAIVHIENDVIDVINILQARLRGFHEAFKQLRAQLPKIDCVLIDGDKTPPQFRAEESIQVKTIIGGDSKVTCIGAASIIAKVTRDRMMVQYDAQFPGYGFAKNKGYYQKSQVEAIQQLGPCPIHRRTFRGVR